MFYAYANNKGADQHARISTFVVRCLDSIIPLVFFIRNFKPLSTLCSCADCVQGVDDLITFWQNSVNIRLNCPDFWHSV